MTFSRQETLRVPRRPLASGLGKEDRTPGATEIVELSRDLSSGPFCHSLGRSPVFPQALCLAQSI